MKRAGIWAGVATMAMAIAIVVWRAVSDGSSPLERAELAVVDRPPTSADSGPEVQILLKLLKETGTAGVHRDAVRMLSRKGDETAILVPIGEIAERDIPDEDELRSEGLCLFYGSDGMSHQMCCGLHELRRAEISGSGETEDSPGPPPGTPTHFYGLVPDGVARVVVTFSGPVPDAPAAVTNNFYDAVSRHPEASNRTGPVRWLDEDGRVIGPTR